MRAAGLELIMTVIEPFTMLSGGPTQTAMSPTQEAGMPPTSTLGTPGPEIGPPTCGIGGKPGVTIGQEWRSVSRAAGGMVELLIDLGHRSLELQDAGGL